MKPDQRIVLIYALFGIGWILFSDQLIGLVSFSPTVSTTLQSIKGIAYVLITGGLLWGLLSIERHRQQREQTSFRYLFMNNPQAMYVFDRETLKVLEVNDMAIKLYGYTRDEFKRLNLFDIRPASDHQRLREYVANRKMNRQDSDAKSWQHINRNGQLIDVDIYSRQIDYQGMPAVLAIVQDMTKQKQSERDRIEIERQFNSILSSMHDVVWSIDFVGEKLLYINDACEEVFGLPVAVLMADIYRWRALVHPDDRDFVVASLESHIKNRLKDNALVYRIITPQGETRWIDQVAWGVFADKKMVRIDGICRDITARVQLNDEKDQKHDLLLALEREKARIVARSNLVSMLSHDFRTPITAIAASSDMLRNYSERMDSDQKNKHYERINNNAMSLNSQLDDLLSLLRAEASESQFQPESQDVIPLMQDVVDSVRLVSGEKYNIEFCKADRIIAEIDGDLLKRVIQNLMMNAVKYSPQGGRVVSCATIDEQKLTITVQDEGLGIDPADIPFLFDPFFRSKRTRHLPGTGLGLRIAQQAVELHGGTIAVKSEVDRGTLFTIQLPLTQGTAQAESLEPQS